MENSTLDNGQITKISRTMSRVLRHDPKSIGLSLDINGWVRTSELRKRLASRFGPISHADIQKIVTENNKKRFEFSDHEIKIRACQGHSVEIDLDLKAVEPPMILYHGTVQRNLAHIKAIGLIKRERQHVHMSYDRETAMTVGSRHGEPVILIVEAMQMHIDGYIFYKSTNGVWLTDNVPFRYITIAYD